MSGYYRYGPRSVAALSNTRYSDDRRDCVYVAMPKIHLSVFERIAVAAHLYAPVSLPPAYEVLTYDERIVSPDTLGYESSTSARRRDEAQEKVVGSSVWRRRIIYFLTVIASIYLLTYPLGSQLPASDEFSNRLRPVSDVIRIVGMALPGAASRWINSYARDPLHFILSAGLVVLLLGLSASLKRRIIDQMRSAWRLSLAKVDLHQGKSYVSTGAGMVQRLLWAALLLIALYPAPARVGHPAPTAPDPFNIFIERITEPYFRFFAIAILVTMLLSDPRSRGSGSSRLTGRPSATLSSGSPRRHSPSCSCSAVSGWPATTSSTFATVLVPSASPTPPRKNSTFAGRATWHCANGIPAATFPQPAQPNVVASKPNSIRAICAPRPGSRSSDVSGTNSRSSARTIGHSLARRQALPACRSRRSCRNRTMAGGRPPSPGCERQP
jgi:hypothetical protein